VSDWELRDPLFLLLGLLAPLVYSLASRLPATVTYSSLEIVDGAPRSLRTRLARLPALLLALATLALAIALAGPRTGNAVSRIKREGIAIVMIVDRSGSMQARDFVEGDLSVSRLDAVKSVFREFVLGTSSGRGRPDDLIGLVGFARYADGLCPLTLDHGNLTSILEDVEIAAERSEDGTAVGEGLALGVERLRRHPARSKVAILLTDGVSNSGDIGPLQAADLAAQHGIKVYAIGAGRTGFAPVPVQSFGGRTVLRRAFVEIDEKTLEQIAERTGGRYFHATDAEGLRQVVSEIDALERTEISEVRYLEYEHHFAAFVGAGLILIAASALLSGTLLRRLP
jgi:Ca-activated chloride channel family protein